jgi:hypothetical protein
VVIVGLIIAFARIAVEQGRELDWDDLILPIAIFMLAAAMKLIRGTEPVHHSEAELREREKAAVDAGGHRHAP